MIDKRPCWMIALTTITNASEQQITKLMKAHGWNGVDVGAPVQTVLDTYWDIKCERPTLAKFKGNVRDWASTKPSGKGLVFTKFHVMPWVDGAVTNYSGHSDDDVFICAQ